MNVDRLLHVYENGCWSLVLHPDGNLVYYSDYEELSKYADSLVEFEKIPCLPKDLENLRSANSAFAIENHILKEKIRELESKLNSMKTKPVHNGGFVLESSTPYQPSAPKQNLYW
jgi:hypothetical protein